MLAPTKLNHKLLDAWLSSKLAKNPRCHLIFVGENEGGEYGKKLHDQIRHSEAAGRIHITGWVTDKNYKKYLSAADLAVQLRTFSRGETSAAVFDCMSAGIPTIVNAHGPQAELPKNSVWMIDDNFEDNDLVSILEYLHADKTKRKLLGKCASKTILEQHFPKLCARYYAEAMETTYQSSDENRSKLLQSIAAQNNLPKDKPILRSLASCIAQNQPDKPTLRNLFVDVSATCRNDLKTGIERVTRALLQAIIHSPPVRYRIEPVYLCDQGHFWHYRYAREYTLSLLGCPKDCLPEAPIEAQPGDKLLIPELSGAMLLEAQKAGVYDILKQIGVSIFATVHDLLPIKMPHCFPPGASKEFEAWIKNICRIADCAVCVSKSTANDLNSWLEENGPSNFFPQITWVHHGADIGNAFPSSGLPEEAEDLLNYIKRNFTFLMVGTIEPRKGHLQTIAAFESLWGEGVDVNLVVVGKEGWQDVSEQNRRTIPQIVKTLNSHPDQNKRLFWLQDISDEYLEKVYDASTCLIAASEGEGFGLPLIEAAQHKLPIIARDIPVFREVAGDHALYFQGKGAAELAGAVQEWLKLYEAGVHPKSDDMPWLTWEQSAAQVVCTLLGVDQAVS
jgi:glycosyltransferase involved in cell wall biosynthesis